MPYLMRIISDALGEPSMHDGLYLKSVTFEVDELGGCFIETTPNPQQAHQFKSTSELLATWKRQSVVCPLRDDLKPNRPLTAWTIETVHSSEATTVHRRWHS